MPRSKLVLFRSPSRSVIIYLDPTKKGNETCICKFHDQEKTVVLNRPRLAEAPSVSNSESNHDTSVNEEEAIEVKETYLEKQVVGKNEVIYLPYTPYSEVNAHVGHVLRTPSTDYKEISLALTSDNDVEKVDSANLSHSNEHPHSEEVLRVPSTDYKEISIVNRQYTHEIKKTESEEPIDQTSDIFEISPSTSVEQSSKLQVTDSLTVIKDPATTSEFKNLSAVNWQSSEKHSTVSSNVEKNTSKSARKTKFAPEVETVEGTDDDENDVIVDEKFINNFATIIEATTVTERKQQLDELLKNISALEVAKAKSDKKNNCWKIFKYGEKGSGFQTKGEAQDFYQLRDNCLQRGVLFEDPEFPPTDSSLFFSHRPDRRFEWKRPGEIVSNPQLFVEGFSRFDVQQGELGDCWLLAAVANLTLYRRLFFQIVPDDQSFEDDYAGIFHFRFWQYGRWIDVVIDDRLPTYRGELVFLHSTEANEFWSALLEKAYAKLHGSYEALKGGSTCEAMEDFTGGVTEMYEMNASPPNLFKIILKAYERWSLMGCSIEPDPDVLEAQTPQGLIRGHAYSITKVQYVNITTPNVAGKIPLLRLRNPWGNESEWNGAWSDHAPEWQYISEDQKEELGLNFDADGEFWISFKDFQTYFNRLEICNLNPDSLSEEELTEGRNKKWVMSVFEGEWVRGVTAGGCRNFLDTFWHNPQYRVTLEEVDEGDDEDKCTLIVALMQKNRRQLRSVGAQDLLTIGFAIYHLPYPDKVPKPLNLNFFKYNASVARSPSFINLREVSCRFKLPRGTYCIVPSTFDPNEEGEFLLRVFSEHQNNMEYDGSYSDNIHSRARDDDSGDVNDDRQPRYPYHDTPSSPYPSTPSNPYSDNPSSPYPQTPSSPYPNPYPSNPYPNNPYPYPQSSYGQYPYPENPQQPYPPHYPQYPQYPYPSNPEPPSPRNSRSSDPITNFFNKLFR